MRPNGRPVGGTGGGSVPSGRETPGVADGFFGISFVPGSREARVFPRDVLRRELSDPAAFSWVDLHAADVGALNDLLREIGVDLSVANYFDAPEVLPRLVERPDCISFYLHEIEHPERHLQTSTGLTELRAARLVLVLGARSVVTFHRRPLEVVDRVRAACVDAFRLAGKSPGFIAFLFLQECLHDFARLNLANDNYLDVIESVLLESKRVRVSGDVAMAGRNILELKRLVASLHVVLMVLATKRIRLVTDDARDSMGDLLHSAIAVRGAIDSSREHLGGIVRTLQTEATNRTNEIVRVLTVLSGLLLPPTLIAGIYGMNFRVMPETEWRFGYPVALGLMAGATLAALFVFRRLGWIGRRRNPR